MESLPSGARLSPSMAVRLRENAESGSLADLVGLRERYELGLADERVYKVHADTPGRHLIPASYQELLTDIPAGRPTPRLQSEVWPVRMRPQRWGGGGMPRASIGY